MHVSLYYTMPFDCTQAGSRHCDAVAPLARHASPFGRLALWLSVWSTQIVTLRVCVCMAGTLFGVLTVRMMRVLSAGQEAETLG